MKKQVVVIGAGFAGLSASCYLAREGYSVTLLEKNNQTGGRARRYSAEGFTFDMGPSWYWMPDVFDAFFNDFGKKTADYYTLKRLDPSYRVVFEGGDTIDVPADWDGMKALFESIEPGSAVHLEKFMAEAEYKYAVGMQDLVHKPGLSITEYMDWRVVSGLFKLHLIQSFDQYVRTYFKNPKLLQLLEFPVLFLGARPQEIPALYSLMNYADIKLGTWYPVGGMHEIVKAMTSLATELGVQIVLNEPVRKIRTQQGLAVGVETASNIYPADIVVGGADYHHVEQHLLDEADRQYTPAYWNKRVMAPSSMLFYIGLNKPVGKLLHHNLFFDADFNQHAHDIYTEPAWPKHPLFYASVTTKTEALGAPEGGENLFILIPTAPGLADTPALCEQYFNMVMTRLEAYTGEDIRSHVVYRRDFAHNAFVSEYNAFKGNAYGLANTLWQTAVLKPRMHSKKIKNLFYTGQLTVPGPGVPPSLISGKVVAEQIKKRHSNN
jgi:phytoene desaturase